MIIIFLDIDGVLNSQKYLIHNYDKVKKFCEEYSNDFSDMKILAQRKMLDIDLNKLEILRNIIETINAKVVIISSWKKLSIYPLIQEKLIDLGIPIVDITMDNGNDRGFGIKKYISDNNIQDYIIFDDEIFSDYDDELLSRLIKTSFYEDGLSEKHKSEVLKKIRKIC